MIPQPCTRMIFHFIGGQGSSLEGVGPNAGFEAVFRSQDSWGEGSVGAKPSTFRGTFVWLPPLICVPISTRPTVEWQQSAGVRSRIV